MDSGKDPISPEEARRREDAVSLQSNPPPDEIPESPKESPPPPDAESPAPAEAPTEKARTAGKHSDELKPGDIVGRYRIDKMIGRGGMATVYRAIDAPKQRIVAVKVLKKRFSSSLKALARFDREFLALESLNHPNIVRVLDKGVEEGVNYFVLEYVNGASLSRLLKYRKLTLNTRTQILLQVAAALDYAHRRGIVHRDVKPDNVLIDRTGRAKLADFGIAQITRSSLPLTSITVVSSFMGTADYMAPEQRVDAKSVDHRADIFAFGVMLYETFTGRLPLGNFSLPSQANPELGRRMDGIILRALQQNPGERYQSMADLAEDLKREMRASGLGKLKARLALVLDTESWKKLVGMRVVSTVSVFAVIVGFLMWLFSAVEEPEPPGTVVPTEETTIALGKPSEPAGPDFEMEFPKTLGDIPEDMVLVTSDEFIMGSNSEFSNERPRHSVYLKAFYIDKYEVTNARYKEFVDATGHPVPFVKTFWAEPFNWRNRTYPPGKGDYPVVLVNWHDADAYAKWAGKRLPMEAEWEKAARGTDARVWPWGKEWDVSKCNIKESFLGSTQPVYLFAEGKSPYGAYNMAGNITEWTADWYSEDYYGRAPKTNPSGPLSGKAKVARGGAWDSNINLYARTAYRHYFQPDTRSASIGFRCVKDVKKKE
jgi:serine/threonine-protein kinase